MSVEVITKADLQIFRMQLLDDLKQILMVQTKAPAKKWLKSSEVRELLSLSAGKLQNLQITGKLPFSQIGGILYYRYEDVEKMSGIDSK